MSGKTISAYADDMTAARVASMAKTEDRSPAQIAAAALRLYVGLPAEARQALRQIEAMDRPDTLNQTQRAIARVLIDQRYELAHQEMMTQMPAATDATEEALQTEAIRLTAKH